MGISINLSGKTVLITGATRGIGSAIADVFIQAGANVLLTGTSQHDIDLLVRKNKSPNIRWLKADFSSGSGIELFLQTLKELAPIDICINSAGINIIKPFENYSSTDYNRLMSINLIAPFRISQQIIPSMKANGFGRIINIASIWSHINKSERSLYSTSKTGLIGFTRSLAVEYGASNILVNAISPGFTETELTRRSLNADELQSLSDQIPLQRIAQPDEVAKVVLFLASDMNTYITGQNIIVDGGFTLV